MHRKEEETNNVYENYGVVMKGKIGKEIADSTQGKSSEFAKSDNVKMRSFRAAAVCLVLLYVLLLTAVVVLSVIFIPERNQLISKNENLTNERYQLISKNENLTSERNQLISKNENLTSERNQLISKNENLTNERDQLISKNENLTIERDQLKWEKNYFQMRDGWIYYQSSVYFISSEARSWTESRRYCTERGADLIIINTREEQDLVKNSPATFWIGLTDSDVEGRWKWVDGSTLTSGFWRSGQPDSYRVDADYASTTSAGWGDYPYTSSFRWICEKTI